MSHRQKVSPQAAEGPESLLRKVFPLMLATLVDGTPRDESDWTFEMKYDGFRAVTAFASGKMAMWTRNGLDLSTRFPAVAAVLEKASMPECVLDGEVVVLDREGAPRFQLLQQAQLGKGGDSVYFVFDLLWLDGRDLRGEPIESRRALLKKLLRSTMRGAAGKTVRPAEQMEPPAQRALAAAKERGYEGLVGKLRGSVYEKGRSKAWIKLKAVNEQELAVIGFTPSNHSDSEIGSLLLGVVDRGSMVFAGKVGTGFSAKERVELKKRLAADADPAARPADAPRMRDATWVRPALVAQVRFTEWTSDGKLRHPSFLGFRLDKTPAECVREVPAGTPKEAKMATSKASGGAASKKKQTASKKGKPAAAGIVLTNPERILYPRDGITKQDLSNYFTAMEDVMLPALKDRPLSLEHWNEGIDKPSWFHQDIGRDAASWMHLVETPKRTDSGTVRHLVADTPKSLQWLAQRSVLTIHMWSSREKSLEHPDWVVFDLDPAKGKGIEQAIDTALVLRKLFDSMELPSIPKTSGKRGIHLLVPLKPRYSHEEAVDFACRLASIVSSQLSWATVERAIAKRAGRLYLDCLQNGYGKTIVAPYSPRAIDGAPVSAPLKWSEVNHKLDPLRFNLRTMPDRVAKLGDLFRPALDEGVKLPRLK